MAIDPLANLVAVPLSGPILILGLLGTVAGNVVAPFAYLRNVSNGALVTVLIWVAKAASALPMAAVATPGGKPPLVGLFYLGCIPAAIAGATLPEERWTRATGLFVVWATLWTVLTAVLCNFTIVCLLLGDTEERKARGEGRPRLDGYRP